MVGVHFGDVDIASAVDGIVAFHDGAVEDQDGILSQGRFKERSLRAGVRETGSAGAAMMGYFLDVKLCSGARLKVGLAICGCKILKWQ